MIKICFCTTVPFTIKSFLLDFVAYIHEEKGWDISFICGEDDEFGKSLPEYIHYYPVKMRRGVNLDGLRAICEIKRICKREKFDLIQYSTPNASLYVSLASKSAKIPVRLYCQWGLVYVGFHGIKKRVFKAIEKTVCRSSTWIEPDSRSNLEFAHKEGLYPAEKGSVIWNGSACGVDLDKFDISKKEEYRKQIREAYAVPPDAFVFGFVGRITRDKGINELLEAYRRIRAEHPNTYLIMVGREEEDGTINRELYDWSKNDPGILYTGYSSTVEQMLSAMDCYVLPSYREGFGTGTIEAEAMGLPVIVTNIPGSKDAVLPGETGLLVEKADTDALYDAMKQMLFEAKKYSEKGYSFVKENFERQQLFKYLLEDREKLINRYLR
ncbi:MAG: glycosyltransferase [Clostridia bacterium]|nr:glycosyltransferase [Clostridia bacterium]